MQPWTTPLLAATALAAAGAASSADIEVMTQNQYVGADLIGVVTEPDFNAAVIEFLQTRATSLPAERAKALAALIAKRKPALVGLQEVYKFSCLEIPAVEDGKGCDNPAIVGAFTDQLDDTLAALGGDYVEAATVVDLDLPDGLTLPDGSPLPVTLPGIPITFDDMTIYLRALDRDVILARKGVPFGVVPYNAICPLPSDDGCNFQFVASANLAVNVPGVGPVPVLVKFQRGFVGVDATVNAVPYRFVNTHLETRLEAFGEPGRYYQSAQAAELLQFMLVYLPPDAGRRLLLVGDMNSDPRDEVFPTVPPGYPPIVAVPPYQQYTAMAPFTDIWTKRPGAATGKGAPLVGFSCCQAEDLLNRTSELYERVDLIFSLTPPMKVQDARLLGESISDKTPPVGKGLWPSDHASVATRLQY
jgi:endonuclease/exonuclease/phosphatase family metal-dependent hydrolase